MAQPSRPANYPLFDWLRFALASIVVLSHSTYIQWPEAGNLAVQVFFALSGWLIGGILIRSHAKDLPRFYFNRATRVWIPYFCTVAALYTLSAIREPITAQWFKFLAYDLTFAHNWFTLWPDAKTAIALMPEKGTGNHFWSIAVEEQFYLLTPAVMYSTRLGKSPLVWAAIFVFLLLIGQTDFASIAAGVLAAFGQRQWAEWRHRGWALAGMTTVICILAAAMHWPAVYPYAAPFFSIAVVLLMAIPGTRGMIGTFFGGISYPIYLNAWIGGYAANEINKHLLPQMSAIHLPVAAVCVFLSGSLTYLAIDRNVLAQRSAWYSHKIGVVIAVTAYTLLAAGLLFGLIVRLTQPH